MSDLQVRDSSDARVTVLTEEELARRRREEGARVVSHAGHYWEQVGAPGFFQPLNLMARLTPDEATRPTPLCWGYRARLTPEAAGAANGSIPIVRLRDLESYDFDRLPSYRRGQIKKCRRLARIVQLTGPRLLLEQGYQTVVDALSRREGQRPPSREKYIAGLKKYFQGDHWLVLAGLIDGKLGGYIDGYVVDGVAYGCKAYFAQWARPTNISTGLVFETIQVFRRCQARTLVNGLHAPELPQLARYKLEMGFEVEHIPSKWRMNPLAQAFIRRRRPYVYYRLTGDQEAIPRAVREADHGAAAAHPLGVAERHGRTAAAAR